jgi:hypothetical protein
VRALLKIILCLILMGVVTNPLFCAYKKPKELPEGFPAFKNWMFDFGLGVMNKTSYDRYVCEFISISTPINNHDFMEYRLVGGGSFYGASILYVYPITWMFFHTSIGIGIGLDTFSYSSSPHSDVVIPFQLKTKVMLSKGIAFGPTFTLDTLGKSSIFFTFQFGDPIIKSSENVSSANVIQNY